MTLSHKSSLHCPLQIVVLLLWTCTSPLPHSTLPPATIQHSMGAAIHEMQKFKPVLCPQIVSPCISSHSSQLYWSLSLSHKCQGSSPYNKNSLMHTNTVYQLTHNAPKVTHTSSPPHPQPVPYRAKCLQLCRNKVMVCSACSLSNREEQAYIC